MIIHRLFALSYFTFTIYILFLAFFIPIGNVKAGTNLPIKNEELLLRYDTNKKNISNQLPLNHKNLSALISLAKKNQLSQSKQWLNLLHYNQGGTLHSSKQSYIKSDDFFLSDTGNENPEAELLKSINLLFGHKLNKTSNEIANTTNEFQCRFPARFKWLSEQLQVTYSDKKLAHCNDFLDMKERLSAKKVVLVFASAYLNNPSSMFGHTLLRIESKNYKNDIDNNSMLNWAINLGADFDQNDNALAYVTKGMSGKYPAHYFIVPYSQKIKEYGQIENRDIWEYHLNLSESEIDFLIAHLWELNNIRFDYYFFDENCSYRLLELIEVVKPELLLSKRFRLAELPTDTIKSLHKEKLINASDFRPSKERQLRQHFSAMTGPEKKLARQLSGNPNIANTPSFKQLSLHRKILIIDNAYRLLRFQQSQKNRDGSIAKNSLALLKLLNTYSLENKNNVTVRKIDKGIKFNADNNSNEKHKDNEKENYTHEKTSLDPLRSHNSQRVGLGFGSNTRGNTFQELEYRMAYHDQLDNGAGFYSGAQIEGPSIKLQRTNNNIYIDNINLVNIMALNPIDTIRQELSWSLAIKAERSHENNTRLNSMIQAGGGYTFAVKNASFYQLLIPRIESSPTSNNLLDLGVELKSGLLFNSGKHAGLLENQILKIKGQKQKVFWRLSQQLELSQNQGLRLNFDYAKQDKTTNKSVQLNYYVYF